MAISNLSSELHDAKEVANQIVYYFWHLDSLESQRMDRDREYQSPMQRDARRIERLLIELDKLVQGLNFNG